MDLTEFHKKMPLKWLAGLTVAVLFVILMAGLKPKDLFPSNKVNWLQNQAGLRFEKYGLAYTDSISDLIQEHVSPKTGFSVEIALKSKDFQEEGFHFIFLLHGGQDRSQLLIGQWRTSLIVMNGDDYSHSRKTKRISVTSSSGLPGTQFLTVTSAPAGTRVYLDGQLAGGNRGLQLTMPEGGNTRLLIGNSVYGNHPWRGDIYGVAIFGKALSETDVEAHFKVWSKAGSFSFAKETAPFIFYNLDQKKGKTALNFSDSAHPLHLPSRLKVLTPSFFFQKWEVRKFHRDLFKDKDAVLNFFGFIPFGFLLAATLIRRGGRTYNRCIAISLSAGFFVSLLIETIQAWMPTRSSDVQDLILNTVGTFVGALCCKYLLTPKAAHKAEKASQD